MLHAQYLQKGATVEMPELSGYVPDGPANFSVSGVFAGGMGICVHLHHTPSGVEYALKGVRPDYVDEQSTVERFLDELQVWLSASACNLIAEAVAVININETPCVLATWMPNGDLAHSLPRLTTTQKIEALLRIVRGLSWVKCNLGVIHRDLKPSNILLDGNGQAYVADWGLARPIGDALKNVGKTMINAVNRPERTQQGSFLGTITYAAPEQIMGSASIDHRADIYALGCMMFEFETGIPPFQGKTVFDIANQHLREKPKKLGGWFRATDLGLERIIARCLEKDPKDRYQSYEQLESDLLPIAHKQGVALERCEPGTRYKRTVLGKGERQQMDMLLNVPNKNRGKDGYMVVEMDDLLPFFKEANDLMALGRYAEAEKIYRPHVLPEMLGKWTQGWGLPHDMAVNYGLCLDRLGRALEAEKIFLMLEKNDSKPAVFYVNYSMALNLLNKSQQAVDLCREGLKYFPNDVDIQGNLTIALIKAGEYERSLDSALKRLKIRRDIHSLDEAANVLVEYATAIRYADLPRAIELAKIAGDLIKEGKHLNPRYFSLRLREISLRRFAYDEQAVVSLAQTIMEDNDCPSIYRQAAFTEMVEKLSEGKAYEAALDLIEKNQNANLIRVKTAKLRTLARRHMLGKETPDGKRVVISDVCDYFLSETEPGCYPDPILAAEIKDWLGDQKAAMAILETHLLEAPNDWDGIKLMAMIFLRQGYFNRAVDIAQLLVKRAPWRAESYDWLAHIAEKAGRNELVAPAKKKGDEVFTQEDRLYTELRTYLDI
ncbi:MAG TPA: protein kinase [Azonexus sp.]|nr:protein kinase [Azonexus sp.]